jgi:membrane protein DedA with SNARE-associated domain
MTIGLYVIAVGWSLADVARPDLFQDRRWRLIPLTLTVVFTFLAVLAWRDWRRERRRHNP